MDGDVMNNKDLKRIALWGKIMGILMMISGAFSAIGGLFVFIIGAIPGVISIILGYYQFKTGDSAKRFIETEREEDIASIIQYYGKFLFLQAIMMLVGIVILFLLLVIWTILGVAILS